MLPLFAGLFACGPTGPEQLEPEDAPEPFLNACDSFCTIAVECPGQYAEQWSFTDQRGCVDECMRFSNGAILNNPGHDQCPEVITQMWECGGSIETCEEFYWFDLASFAMAGLGATQCGDELYTFLQQCN